MKPGPKLDTRTQVSQDIHGTEPLTFDGKEWTQVTSEVNWAHNPNNHWVSLGSSSEFRENLFIDVTSELFMDLRMKAVMECEGKSIPEVLETINRLVNDINLESQRWKGQLPDNKQLEATLKVQIQSKPRDEQGFVNLNLDELAEQGLLVCRHRAVIAASLIASMIDAQILPEGNVRQYRSSIDDSQGQIIGSHTWATFRESTSGELWLCDPTWNNSLKVEKGSENLEKYGEIAVAEMIERLDRLDGVETPKFKEPPIVNLKRPLTKEELLKEVSKLDEDIDIAKDNLTRTDLSADTIRKFEDRVTKLTEMKQNMLQQIQALDIQAKGKNEEKKDEFGVFNTPVHTPGRSAHHAQTKAQKDVKVESPSVESPRTKQGL